MSGQFKKYGGVSNYQKSEQIQTDSLTSNYLQTRNFISEQFNGTSRKYMLTINDDVISANDNRIQNVADPLEPGDALNLDYFHRYNTNTVGGYVKREGDTMTGPLKMDTNGYFEIDADEGNGRFSVGDGAVYIESSVENGTINFSYFDSTVPIFQLNTKTGLESIIAYANLDMRQNKISNLPNPTNDTDAVTLGYLQSNYYTQGDSNSTFFKNTGGTISGGININGDVDITGTINLNNNKLISLGNPTNDADAVNLAYLKSYVSGNTTGIFVKTSGDSMNGPLNITPVASHKPNPALVVNNANIMDTGYTYDQYLTQKNLGTVRDGAAIRIQNTTNNEGSTYIGHLYVGGQGNAGYIQSQDNGIPTLSNSWSNFLLNPKGGNVGIGLSAPVEVLDINGSTMIRGDGSSALRLSTQSGGNFIESGTTTNHGSTADLYFSSMGATQNNMVIKANGLVGINTIEPTEQLDVYGTAQFNNGDNYMNVSSVGTVHINTQGSDEEQLILSSKWHQMLFQCDYGTGETLIDVIRSNNAKIDIGAYSDNSEAHTTYDVEGGQSNINHYGNVICNNDLTMNLPTGHLYVHDICSANGTAFTLSHAAGNVQNQMSIQPDYINVNGTFQTQVLKLPTSVSSGFSFTPNISGSTAEAIMKGYGFDDSIYFTFNDDVKAPKFITTSDERMKHNVQDIPDALSVIKKLNVKKYVKTKEFYTPGHNFSQDASGNYIDNSGNIIPETQQEIGIIAQDVRDNIDELSHIIHGEETVTDACGNTVNKSLAVSYHDIFALNIQATQELFDKNHQLEISYNYVLNELNILKSKHFLNAKRTNSFNSTLSNYSIFALFNTYNNNDLINGNNYIVNTNGLYSVTISLCLNNNSEYDLTINIIRNNNSIAIFDGKIQHNLNITYTYEWDENDIIDFKLNTIVAVPIKEYSFINIYKI